MSVCADVVPIALSHPDAVTCNVGEEGCGAKLAFSVEDGSGTSTWKSAGNIPDGMVWEDGQFSGAPTRAGRFDVWAKVRDTVCKKTEKETIDLIVREAIALKVFRRSAFDAVFGAIAGVLHSIISDGTANAGTGQFQTEQRWVELEQGDAIELTPSSVLRIDVEGTDPNGYRWLASADRNASAVCLTASAPGENRTCREGSVSLSGAKSAYLFLRNGATDVSAIRLSVGSDFADPVERDIAVRYPPPPPTVISEELVGLRAKLLLAPLTDFDQTITMSLCRNKEGTDCRYSEVRRVDCPSPDADCIVEFGTVVSRDDQGSFGIAEADLAYIKLVSDREAVTGGFMLMGWWQRRWSDDRVEHSQRLHYFNPCLLKVLGGDRWVKLGDDTVVCIQSETQSHPDAGTGDLIRVQIKGGELSFNGGYYGAGAEGRMTHFEDEAPADVVSLVMRHDTVGTEMTFGDYAFDLALFDNKKPAGARAFKDGDDDWGLAALDAYVFSARGSFANMIFDEDDNWTGGSISQAYQQDLSGVVYDDPEYTAEPSDDSSSQPQSQWSAFETMSDDDARRVFFGIEPTDGSYRTGSAALMSGGDEGAGQGAQEAPAMTGEGDAAASAAIRSVIRALTGG